MAGTAAPEAELRNSLELDESFLKWLAEVRPLVGQLDKRSRIRIQAWLEKMQEPTNNPVWKRNRNLYARLLLGQLRSGSPLDQPFTAMPPQGALPTLQRHLTYRYLAPSPRRTRSRSGSPAASPQREQQQQQREQQQQQQQQQQGQQQRQGLQGPSSQGRGGGAAVGGGRSDAIARQSPSPSPAHRGSVAAQPATAGSVRPASRGRHQPATEPPRRAEPTTPWRSGGTSPGRNMRSSRDTLDASRAAFGSVIPAVAVHEVRQRVDLEGGRTDLLEWRLKQAEAKLRQQDSELRALRSSGGTPAAAAADDRAQVQVAAQRAEVAASLDQAIARLADASLGDGANASGREGGGQRGDARLGGGPVKMLLDELSSAEKHTATSREQDLGGHRQAETGAAAPADVAGLAASAVELDRLLREAAGPSPDGAAEHAGPAAATASHPGRASLLSPPRHTPAAASEPASLGVGCYGSAPSPGAAATDPTHRALHARLERLAAETDALRDRHQERRAALQREQEQRQRREGEQGEEEGRVREAERERQRWLRRQGREEAAAAERGAASARGEGGSVRESMPALLQRLGGGAASLPLLVQRLMGFSDSPEEERSTEPLMQLSERTSAGAALAAAGSSFSFAFPSAAQSGMAATPAPLRRGWSPPPRERGRSPPRPSTLVREQRGSGSPRSLSSPRRRQPPPPALRPPSPDLMARARRQLTTTTIEATSLLPLRHSALSPNHPSASPLPLSSLLHWQALPVRSPGSAASSSPGSRSRSRSGSPVARLAHVHREGRYDRESSPRSTVTEVPTLHGGGSVERDWGQGGDRDGQRGGGGWRESSSARRFDVAGQEVGEAGMARAEQGRGGGGRPGEAVGGGSQAARSASARSDDRKAGRAPSPSLSHMHCQQERTAATHMHQRSPTPSQYSSQLLPQQQRGQSGAVPPLALQAIEREVAVFELDVASLRARMEQLWQLPAMAGPTNAPQQQSTSEDGEWVTEAADAAAASAAARSRCLPLLRRAFLHLGEGLELARRRLGLGSAAALAQRERRHARSPPASGGAPWRPAGLSGGPSSPSPSPLLSPSRAPPAYSRRSSSQPHPRPTSPSFALSPQHSNRIARMQAKAAAAAATAATGISRPNHVGVDPDLVASVCEDLQSEVAELAQALRRLALAVPVPMRSSPRKRRGPAEGDFRSGAGDGVGGGGVEEVEVEDREDVEHELLMEQRVLVEEEVGHEAAELVALGRRLAEALGTLAQQSQVQQARNGLGSSARRSVAMGRRSASPASERPLRADADAAGWSQQQQQPSHESSMQEPSRRSALRPSPEAASARGAPSVTSSLRSILAHASALAHAGRADEAYAPAHAPTPSLLTAPGASSLRVQHSPRHHFSFPSVRGHLAGGVLSIRSTSTPPSYPRSAAAGPTPLTLLSPIQPLDLTSTLRRAASASSQHARGRASSPSRRYEQPPPSSRYQAPTRIRGGGHGPSMSPASARAPMGPASASWSSSWQAAGMSGAGLGGRRMRPGATADAAASAASRAGSDLQSTGVGRGGAAFDPGLLSELEAHPQASSEEGTRGGADVGLGQGSGRREQGGGGSAGLVQGGVLDPGLLSELEMQALSDGAHARVVAEMLSPSLQLDEWERKAGRGLGAGGEGVGGLLARAQAAEEEAAAVRRRLLAMEEGEGRSAGEKGERGPSMTTATGEGARILREAAEQLPSDLLPPPLAVPLGSPAVLPDSDVVGRPAVRLLPSALRDSLLQADTSLPGSSRLATLGTVGATAGGNGQGAGWRAGSAASGAAAVLRPDGAPSASSAPSTAAAARPTLMLSPLQQSLRAAAEAEARHVDAFRRQNAALMQEHPHPQQQQQQQQQQQPFLAGPPTTTLEQLRRLRQAYQSANIAPAAAAPASPPTAPAATAAASSSHPYSSATGAHGAQPVGGTAAALRTAAPLVPRTAGLADVLYQARRDDAAYRAVRLQLRDGETFNQEVLRGFQELKARLGLDPGLGDVTLGTRGPNRLDLDAGFSYVGGDGTAADRASAARGAAAASATDGMGGVPALEERVYWSLREGLTGQGEVHDPLSRLQASGPQTVDVGVARQQARGLYMMPSAPPLMQRQQEERAGAMTSFRTAAAEASGTLGQLRSPARGEPQRRQQPAGLNDRLAALQQRTLQLQQRMGQIAATAHYIPPF